MTNHETARCNTYKFSQAHLFIKKAIAKEVPAFEKECLAAQKLLDHFHAIHIRNREKTAGATRKKQQHRDELLREVSSIAAVITGYGQEHNDIELIVSMISGLSELRHAGETRLLGFCCNILGRVRKLGNALVPYGIDDEKLKKFENAHALYTGINLQPRNEVAGRRESGGQENVTTEELTGIFAERIDDMLLLFQPSHRGIYSMYHTSRADNLPAPGGTRVEGKIVLKPGSAVKGKVRITLVGTDTVVYANEDGSYAIKAPALSAVKLAYELESYKPVVVQVTIKRGHVSIQDVEMEPA